DAKTLSALRLDLVENEGELLYRADDDLLSLFDEFSEITRMLGMPDGRAHLHELLDRRLQLIVQNPPVRHDDERIEGVAIVDLDPDELMRQPRDGLRFAAAGRMLDQITPPDAALRYISQKLPHAIELMIAREDLHSRLSCR